MSIRPSRLQLAKHCQLSAVLSARYPSTNANIVRGQDVDAQVSAWVQGGPEPLDPVAVLLTNWVARHMTECQAQVPCRLIGTDGSLVTEGTADLVGLDSWDPGLLLVADIKKREQWLAGHVAPPDENLQLHAYALAQVRQRGLSRYRTALLLFGDTDVQDVWSREYGPEEWGPYQLEIENICAQKPSDGKDPTGKAGPHCTGCYPRLHCPHWALPALEGGDSALAALSEPAGLTSATAGRAYLAIKALKEMAEQAEEILKAWARAPGNSVTVGDKQWRPITQPGRKSADVAALEQAGLRGYIKQGPPFEAWRLTRPSSRE